MTANYETARLQGSKIVFANGCFDMLHPGHVSLLQFASSLGFLIVGLNSDSSVRKLKGSGRPLLSQEEREYMLRACRYVDQVIVFDQDTPLQTIEAIRPDIIVKGGDYVGKHVVGSHVAEVKIFTPVFDISTSKLLQKVAMGGRA